MDLHFGEIHRANLGDGQGEKDQQLLMREYYMPIIGTCIESLIGILFSIHTCSRNLDVLHILQVGIIFALGTRMVVLLLVTRGS